MKLKLIIILLFFCVNSFSQTTFTKWINNVDYDEGVRRFSEISPGKYLCNLYKQNLNFNLPLTAFDKISILYILNDTGNITDSLFIEKLDEYYIVVRNVIRSENNDILFLCNALNETTLDIQLCLLHTDYNLNIQSYDFYGSQDTVELITDFCINNNNNIVLIGLDSYESGEGGHLLWEIDFEGNSLTYMIDDTLSLLIPSILQIPGTGRYHINDAGGVLIYSADFEYDTIIILENADVFQDKPQRHKLIDDLHYIKIGKHFVYSGTIPPEDPWDMAFLILNDEYQIENTFLFGVTDTLDYPGKIDFINTNRIFFSGIKNYITMPPEDTWLCLYITNLNGDTLQSRFYGGYGLYSPSTGLATSDGGYIIAARWFDFHNYVPPGPVDTDILIMKVDENGLLTNIPSAIPFEQTDVIVYPNPGKECIKIESSLKNLRFQLFDVSGELVIREDFNSSVKLNTDNLPAGSYIYRITKNEEIIKTGKWIKK